jgi:hypothetical protein
MARQIPQADKNFAHELTSVIMNVLPLYNQHRAIEQNMTRKLMRGKFDFLLSVKGFRYVVDAANTYYKKEFGESADVPTRNFAALLLAYDYASQSPQLRDEAERQMEAYNRS